MGRRLQIEWQESAAELKAPYQQEKQAQRRIRLLALWHLRQGERIQEVARLMATPERVIQRWIKGYRQGGLAAVLRRVTGHGASGKAAYLSVQQQRALGTRVALGDLRTVWEVVQGVEDRWGLHYS